MFFTNTKTVEFIKFSLLDFFSPQKENSKMSSLKDAYYTPTYVGGWDAREREEDTYRNNLKHIIVSSRVLQTWPPLHVRGEKA